MILTVVLGNQSISLAFFAPDAEGEVTTPAACVRLSAMPARTEDEYEALLPMLSGWRLTDTEEVEAIVLASVVPSHTAPLSKALRRLLPDAALLTVGAGLRTGFAIRTDTPAELGADLVANVSGALTVARPPFLVLDCGAVTTLCAVDGTEEAPLFKGCCILPGLSMSAEALHEGAALLSDVALARPVTAIGTNSADSMRAGLMFGQADAISGLVSRFEADLGRGALPVIATGEEAELLLPMLAREMPLEEHLSHKGLYRMAMLNMAKIEKARKRG